MTDDIVAFIQGCTCSVADCGRSGKLTRSMCGKHYRHWLDHTPPDQRPTAPRFVDDFWSHVEKSHEHGCWRWTGATVGRGHGRWRRMLAHRRSWELANGPIQDGLWVLHHCDNAPCVNPRHLYLGTIVENTRDAVERGRIYKPPRKTHCSKGHEIAGGNLRVIRCTNGNVLHKCRTCDNERCAAWSQQRRRDRGLRKTYMTEDERAQIIDLRRSGMSQRKIAGVVGRALTTVQRALRESAA